MPIEVENKVITLINDYLQSHFAETISLSSDIDYIPASFPHVSIVESDSENYTDTIDTDSNENHVRSLIDINIYTDDKDGRKEHAKEIFEVIDEIMLFKGFIRISKTQITTDDTLYRLNVRYQGIVDKYFNVYRR